MSTIKQVKHLGVFNGKKFWASSVHFETTEKGFVEIGEYHDGELKTTYLNNVKEVNIVVFKGKEQISASRFVSSGDFSSLKYYRRFILKSVDIRLRDADVVLEMI